MGAPPSGLTAKDPVESVPHEGPIDSSHGALSNAGGDGRAIGSVVC